jgi:rfaE bifunctional protein nucleotidyltransferase chain/domain
MNTSNKIIHHESQLESFLEEIGPPPHFSKSMAKFVGRPLVFTNGCFDIVHVGHIVYLEQAKSLGDKLFVAINSDSSVKALKGPSRPVFNEMERLRHLAAFACVDKVMLFDEETPYELIAKIRPDILVKGGDWKKEDIVGHDIVESYNGQVKSLKFIEGYSTTQAIDHIVRTHS